MNIVKSIQSELKKHVDIDYKKGAERYFKEPVEYYGVRAGIVRRIANKYWKNIKALDKKEIYAICEELLKTNYSEDALVVAAWGYNFDKFTEELDIKIFESWVDKYLNNWGKIDTFCTHALGDYFVKFPEQTNILLKWTKSKNRWVRRASAVSLIIPAAKGQFLDLVFQISDSLLLDKDDLVRKGYGWMLKSAAESHQKKVFDYVIKNKQIMPRTSLRYAIEKMPKNLKKRAMER